MFSDAEWIEARASRKQISQKKTGNVPFKLDFGRNTDKSLFGDPVMASPVNLLTKTLPNKMKSINLGPTDMGQT